jgi:hypothetical protein
MKKIPVFFGIWTLLTAGLFGRTQSFEVTRQALDAWQISGTELSSLAAQSELILPAGAQLSRSFAPGVVTVHLVSKPFFGSDPGDCPSLEVGPASLAFVRDNSEGKLALIVGNGTPAALPVAIPLGEDGRSAQPLDLTLSFDGASGLVTVTIPGQPLLSVSGAASGSAVEVAVAAGTQIAWPIGSLEVVVSTPDSPIASGNAADSPASATSLSSAGIKSGDASASSSNPPTTGASHLVPAVGSTAPTVASQPSASATASATLQVFTPPSVRWRPAPFVSAQTQPTGAATGK